ncbi:alpha-2-macroglobulin [Pasteurella canis]|uniref:alpha-2-macroglobulin n=1 Tax=Pasteurella canis TaxID=753 RepID=UPI000D8493DD|nr:alpha-2-macroglobulin [Pasteurella canis]SPY33081.1 alpha-2-macroglobulin family protein [Pasteurella canis]
MNKRNFFSLFGLLTMVFMLTSCWENKEDDKNAISFTLNPIESTNYYENPKEVYPLVITFNGPAAPITSVNKEVQEGISIEPAIKGKWFWNTDTMLSFKPENDWPAGQEYKIKIDEKILNPQHTYVKALKKPFTVTTPSFSADITEQYFYQDPNQAHIRYAIVGVSFSHPVDKEKFEKAIQINLVRQNNDDTRHVISPLKFKVRYAENDLVAWIHSDSVSLAQSNNQYIETKINQNLTALLGGNPLEESLVANVEVPTKFSLDYSSGIIIAQNEKNEAEQILNLTFTKLVKGSDIAKNIAAFLLPEKAPNNNSHWNYNQINQALLNQAEKVTLKLLPTETAYTHTQNFQLDIPEKRCLYLQINHHFSALGGYQFKKPLGELICAPEYPKHVGFIGNGSILSSVGEQKLTISSRNFNEIKLQVGRIQEEQLRHLVSLNQGDFQNPNLGQLKIDHIADFMTKTYTVNNQYPQKTNYIGIDLAHLFKTNTLSAGIYWLKVSGDDKNISSSLRDTSQNYDWRNDANNQFSDYRLIVLTDLGIIAKKANDGSQMVFVQSISTGEAVEGASVSVISRNGSIIKTGFSDEQGVIHFASLDHFKQELAPVMYLVSTEDQMSFLPIDKYDRSLDYSRFDVGGVYTEQDMAGLKAYLFNDRGIYRPNETVHTGIITKSQDWRTALTNVPLKFQIISPSGRTMLKQTVRLDKSGLNSVNFTLPEVAETGEWFAQLLIGEHNKQKEIGSMTFQVQEFQPDTLKIKTTFNQSAVEGWINPRDLIATVKLTNLFGTPAQNRRVSAELTLHPVLPKFSQYENYQFFDNQRNKSAILYETTLNEQTTDKDGQATFPIDLSQYAENTAQMLYFTADGFESNSGRAVSTVKSVMVSAQPWLIGYQSNVDLSYLKRNTPQQIHFIALNPTLEKIAVEGLKATLFERQYLSVLTQQPSGAYKYESKLVENEIEQHDIQLTSAGLDFVLNTKKSGDFVLVLTNEYEQEVNRIHYTVIGNQNLTVAMDKNTELKLRLNKKQFQPNDEIEIAIQAPYAGSGLITIERDRVYAHKWFKATTNSSVQRIKLPANFEGNGYINVQFSRDINSSDIFTSPLSYGVVPFTVNVDNRRLKLELTSPKQVKSGEVIEFKLTSNKPSKALIYAVNEGILQVANYKFTDPLNYFFPKQALQVQTSQILDLILPEFSKVMQFAKTGGDAEIGMELAMKMAMANTNPFKRKADKPVAYWSGVVDVNGETTVTYQIPEEFNGNLKVMAIAVNHEGNQIGHVETATTVRNDLILSPTVPLTLTPNDQAEISVNIANNTNRTQQVKIKVDVEPQIHLIGEVEKIVEVTPMSESAVNFMIKATEQLGSSQIRFNATYLNAQQQPLDVMRHVTLSVRPIMPKQFVTQIDKVDAGKTVNTALPLTLFPQYRTQSALFSPTPLVLAQSISTYLSQYDNYCTEQIISSAIPTLLFSQNKAYQPLLHNLAVNNLGKTQISEQTIQQSLQKVLTLLPNRQRADGSYGVWNDIEQGEIFLTAYVAHFLIEAQERHIPLPQAWFGQNGLFNNTISALEYQSIPQEGDSLIDLRQRAYSAYLLTRLGQVPSNALLSIRTMLEQHFNAKDWQSDTLSAWLSAAYQLLKQDEEAHKLLENVIAKLNSERDVQWLYRHYSDPLIQDSSMLYVIARHFPKELAKVSEKVLTRIAQDLNQQRYNTLSSAMVLLALDAYAQQNQAELSALHIQQNGQDISQSNSLFRYADLTETQMNLDFVNSSTQAAWFALSQSGYPQTADNKALSNGLEIYRSYTDKEGNEVKSVQIGETIYATIKVRSIADYLTDVIITDLYPAGFEVIWQSDVEEASVDAWYPQHSEVREDRILSYGSVEGEMKTLKYQLKAVNIGTFQIPPVYAESMYDRTIKAYSANEGQIKVTK